MKRLLPSLLLVLAANADADDAKIHRTDPVGREKGQAYEVEGEKVFETDAVGRKLGQAFEIDGEVDGAART